MRGSRTAGSTGQLLPLILSGGTDTMKRAIPLLLSLLLVLTALTACGGDSEKTGAGHSFSFTLVGNPDTLDPQLAVNTSAKTVLANLFEGLFTLGEDGSLRNGVVRDWQVSDDKLHYTFDLRQDSYWYSTAEGQNPFDKEAAVKVTANDFVFAFQRMFDPIYHSPYKESFSSIRYAREITDGGQDPSLIGVYARRDDRLEIELERPDSGLLTKLASTAALPCNQTYFEMTKGRYGLDEQSIIGNGSFAMQRWLYDPYGKYNVIQLSRNPLNHAVHKVYPVDLNFYIEQTDADAVRIFTKGNTDCCVTTQTDLLSNTSATVSGAFSLTLGIIANPNSDYGKTPKIAQAMRAALDYASMPLYDDLRPASGILPPASVLMNKSCRELISDVSYRVNSPEQAKQLLNAGLAAVSRSELAEGKVLVPSDLMDYSALLEVLKHWENTLSLHLSLEEVAPAEFGQRLSSGSYDLALYTLTGEDHNPSSVLEHFLTDSCLHCGAADAVRQCLKETAGAPELPKAVELYSRAEADILDDACLIPLFYKKRVLVCKPGVKDVLFNPFSGQVQFTEAKFFG